MKIISWNVNSIRARINYVKELLRTEKPDFLCLQETKIIDKDFPNKKFTELGYFSYFFGIPSYNGVAILSKEKLINIEKQGICNKLDARILSAKTSDFDILSVYVPAGGDIPDPHVNPKFKHKLLFLDELNQLLKTKKKIIVCGDLNVAPYKDDVWSHKSLINVVSHTEIEREKLKKILEDCNLIDAVRYFVNPPQNIYTWWSYRSPNYKINNRGRRLDHIWVSKQIKNKLVSSKILDKYRSKDKPSDHVPVCLEMKN